MADALTCKLDSCNRLARNAHKPGYCAAHEARVYKHGDPMEHIPVRDKPPKVCIADGCTVPSRSRGYCATHYSRLKKWGTLDTTGRRTFRKCKPGDTRLDTNGYVKVKAPDHSEANSNGWAFEHRYVMANHLGRPLKTTENIHHINGDRADNRIENLEIWNTAQPSGQRAQDKIDFAIYILKLYCPDRLAE